MGQGLRTWDQYGNLMINTDDRLPRVLGTVYANKIEDGEIFVSDFNQGTPWVLALVDWGYIFADNHSSSAEDHNYAVARIEGNYVRWSWSPRTDGNGFFHATLIVYGVY